MNNQANAFNLLTYENKKKVNEKINELFKSQEKEQGEHDGQ